MVDINKLLGGLNKSGVTGGLLGGLAGGAVSGAMMSKKGRKTAKKVIKYGSIAAVGTLAWKAYQGYKSNNAEPTAPQQNLNEEQFHNLDAPEANSDSLFVLKAMIAAAMADGHIDGKEYQNILGRADELGLDNEEKTIIFDEIKSPMPVELVIAQTPNQVMAVEVYTASLLAIDESRPEAQDYLNKLATGLDLPEPLVNSIHHEASQAV